MYYQRNPNFCERIQSSLVAFLFGLVLLAAGSCMLFWNEGRAVQTAKSLDEGLRLTVSLPTSQIVSMENNGKLVHLKGPLHTDKILQDEEYNIGIKAVKLRRSVEMYQWVEHEHETKHDEGNGQTRVEKSYSYTQEWRSDIVRSSSFDNSFSYMNPTEMSVQPMTYEAESVYVGQFLLSKGLVSKVTNFQHLRANHAMIKNSNLKVFDGFFYHGNDPTKPQVGDLRVKFEFAGISGDTSHGPPDQVSIVARQMNNNLLPYQTLAGDPLEILYVGSLTAQEIFNKEKMSNTMLTWGLRFLGWLIMFFGFSCLTAIITTLVDWIPIVRELIGLGVCLMNVSLAISLSLTIIAVAWIFYRPWLGITLLVLGMIPFIMPRLSGSQSPPPYSRYRAD